MAFSKDAECAMKSKQAATNQRWKVSDMIPSSDVLAKRRKLSNVPRKEFSASISLKHWGPWGQVGLLTGPMHFHLALAENESYTMQKWWWPCQKDKSTPSTFYTTSCVSSKGDPIPLKSSNNQGGWKFPETNQTYASTERQGKVQTKTNFVTSLFCHLPRNGSHCSAQLIWQIASAVAGLN